MITATASGISAAALHCLEQGALAFFARQGNGVLAGFVRQEGGNPLPEEFAALVAPCCWQEPARRGEYGKKDGTHWMLISPGDHDS
jgi:hypothetical protein